MLHNWYKIHSPLKYIVFCIDCIGYIIWSPVILYNYYKKISKPTSILVIKNDFIGDLIIATPVFKAIKQAYPKSLLTVACRTFSKQALHNNPYVDNILELNTPWLSRRDAWSYKKIWKVVVEAFKTYEVVIDLHTEPRNILLGKMLGKNLVSYGYRGLGFLATKKPRTEWKQKPMVEQNLELLKPLGITAKNAKLELFLSPEEKNNAKQLIKKLKLDNQKKTIAIHPGTSDPIRQWPLDRFNSLIKKIQRRYNVLVVDDDAKRGKQVCKNTKAVNLSGKLSLRAFFSLIGEMNALIGLESLSVHAAAALNIPILDIHSSTTKSQVMGPYTKKKIVLQKKTRCQHCSKTCCPHNKGIHKIKVEEVIQGLKRLLHDA